MFQNDPSGVLKRGSDPMVSAILAATLLLGGFTAFSVVVLAYEIFSLFQH